MNKYIVSISTDFCTRQYSALAMSWTDPKLREIAETLGYIMVEENVPQDYIIQVEGYEWKDYDEDALAEMIANTDMSKYFDINIEPFEDKDFNAYELIYDASKEA